MVGKFEDTKDLLDISFQAIEHPELVYKTSRDIEIAAFSSVLTFLFVVVAIQTIQGLDVFQLLLLFGPSMLTLFLSVLFFARSLISFMNAEFNRRQNTVLFANSILTKESDTSYTNYQMYNIRVLRTHTSGPYPLYVGLIIIAISLFITQIVIDSGGETISGNMVYLFGLIISGTSFTLVTFVALLNIIIGILGLGFRIFSDVNIARWNSKSETQIRDEAEKCVAAYSRGVQITYEEAAKIFKDAENGSPEAIEQKDLMAEGMNREIGRFRKVRFVFILCIVIVTIIDIIVALLPP
ncbi:MAG: hypothetical protein RTV31_03860 [Candidatus Thorarchaeota archaeon]